VPFDNNPLYYGLTNWQWTEILADRFKRKKTSNYQLLTCDCSDTIPLNCKKLAKDLGLDDEPERHHNLCRTQVAKFEQTVSNNPNDKIIVTCTQEAPLFQDIASEIGDVDLSFVNIRESAGWAKSGAKATAKMAALIAESAVEVKPTGLFPVTSNGACVVYGAGQPAVDVAVKLSGRLDVSLILSDPTDVILPASTQFPVYRGNVSRASGSLGNYSLSVADYAAVSPSSKSTLEFGANQKNAEVECDLIFDLSTGSPLTGTSHRRDGYVQVDPANSVGIAEAMFDIVDLVGEFERTMFVGYDKSICAHSRNGITGCSNCIDACPSTAITSDGDGIFVDKDICDGCGHCSSSCPTGAIFYTFPNRDDLVARCQVLISTYLQAGGQNPVLLVHETEHGEALISAMARYGDGLADNVLPFSVHSISHLGHDALSAFFTTGIQSVVLLAPVKKRDELENLKLESDLTNHFLEVMNFGKNVRVQILCEDDPDAVGEALAKIPRVKSPKPQNFIAGKSKRETARLALIKLNAMAPVALEIMDLPEHAPYGSIEVDTELCTLCLSCVGACPANALSDREDRPQLSFKESACVQCGLCKSTCPEDAISLKTQFNFDSSALTPIVLNTEEPLDCVSCGKPFGSKSAVEKVIETLAGKNPMFQTSDQINLLRMCETCRVVSMAELRDDPMTLGTVPKTMTAADILPEDEEPTRH